MKVLLYYPWLYLKGGAERVILETLKRSRHQYRVVTHHYDKDSTFPEFEKYDVVQLKHKISVKRNYYNTALGVATILSEKLDLHNYDAFLLHCDGVGNMITFRNNSIPCYCYCHTPLRPAYDEMYRKQYLEKTGRSSLVFDLFASGYRSVDRLAWKKYRKIYCNSMETKKRILRYFPHYDHKVDVLNPGMDASVDCGRVEYNPFFLIAGRIMWTKNIILGIEAFIDWKRTSGSGAEFTLVIAGGVDEKSREYHRLLQDKVGDRKDVVFRINPTDSDLMQLYRDCYAIVFTSFNEDWGLIPLEAGAFGKTTIAVNRGGPRESILDGETGFLCEPSPKEFSSKMALLAANKNMTMKMGSAAKRNVAKYDWKCFFLKLDLALES